MNLFLALFLNGSIYAIIPSRCARYAVSIDERLAEGQARRAESRIGDIRMMEDSYVETKVEALQDNLTKVTRYC